MYIVTNRKINARYKSIRAFGNRPNEHGNNELRLAKVERRRGRFSVNVLQDELTASEKKKLIEQFDLSVSANQTLYRSLSVACEVFTLAHAEQKPIVFYVHGYNNDVEDILETAEEIEQTYNVIVVCFSWPANGGGPISGTASYLSDKRDARASTEAFNRFVGKLQSLHALLLDGVKKSIDKKVSAKYPDNPERASELYAELIKKSCNIKLVLLCHSMGNYLLKHSLKTGESQLLNLTFDNICLVAADTNNASHPSWIDKLDVRNRIYVVINENDGALKVSRLKPGKEQKARLGHSVRELTSPKATYLDLTHAEHIGTDHSYFKGRAVSDKTAVWHIFDKLFSGQTAEELMQFFPPHNTYRPVILVP